MKTLFNIFTICLCILLYNSVSIAYVVDATPYPVAGDPPRDGWMWNLAISELGDDYSHIKDLHICIGKKSLADFNEQVVPNIIFPENFGPVMWERNVNRDPATGNVYVNFYKGMGGVVLTAGNSYFRAEFTRVVFNKVKLFKLKMTSVIPTTNGTQLWDPDLHVVDGFPQAKPGLILACLDGPSNVPINSVNTFYSISSQGFWTISNFPPCNASIVGSNLYDSLIVDAGNAGGHFILYFNCTDSCSDSLCIMHVYVDNPLPVELSSFSSTVNKNNVTLNWITSAEINNSGFDVERKSASSNEWSKIRFVNGNGTTNEPVFYSFLDKNLNQGKYNYRLKQIDFNGNYEYYNLSGEVVIGGSRYYGLSQNFPNPFNPTTKISYEIPLAGFVTLKIYDVSGKEVAKLVDQKQEAGYYTELFDGSSLSSGIYFYKLTAGDFVEMKRMVLLK